MGQEWQSDYFLMYEESYQLTSDKNAQLYRSPKWIFWIALAVLVFINIRGIAHGGLSAEQGALAVTASITLLGFVYLFLHNMYVKISEENTLVVSWHNRIGEVTVRIPDVRYVFRVPMYIVPSFGTKMVLYVECDGVLQHLTILEGGLNDLSLREILSKLKRYSPRLVLDDEYEDFLERKSDGKKDSPFVGTATKNSLESVEAFLKERGEILR